MKTVISRQYIVDSGTKKILFLILILSTIYYLLPAFLSAQTNTGPEYQLLAPVPFVETSPDSGKTNTAKYIPGLVQLIIAIAGVLAVIMLMFGGIKYMSTDAFSGKEEGKNIINNAIWGLALALSAWLILYTANPSLTTINLSIKRPTPPPALTPVPGGRPGYTLTTAQISQDQSIRNTLRNNNPPVLVPNPACATGGTRGCTNVVDLPQRAIAGVSSFASSCRTAMGTDCAVIITGGTEGGHETHGPNLPVIDIRRNPNDNLDRYITTKGERVSINSCSRLGAQYRLNGATYVNEGNHWHVCYQ